MSVPNFPVLNPKVVLGIAAHPDDLDFGAAGTLAQFAAAGAEVHYLILTDGSNGTADPAMSPAELITLRQSEQRAALKALGGNEVHFLDFKDGELEITMDLKKAIVKAIRTIKPDVVVTMDPSVLYSADRGMINHPDHRAAGQATLDAVFPLARDHLSFPDLYEAGYQPHKVSTVLLINFNEHNVTYDISATIDKKLAALDAHASQMPDTGRIHALVEDIASQVGASCNCAHAEGFIRIDVSS